MTHLGLFEGIGGFSLAARWAGWQTVAWVEINEFGQKVLRHHFPEAEGHGDIKTFDGTKYRGVDIVTGGFPCQPFSSAGKRKGTDDERHLWPQMLRVIREVSPRYIVAENVRGFTNWNGGMVFDQVQADLEAEGYEVLPFLLPACAVNAPHRRDRIWIVAHAINDRYNTGREKIRKQDEVSGKHRKEMGSGKFNGANFSWPLSEIWPTPDTGGEQSQGRMHTGRPGTAERHPGPRNSRTDQRPTWDNFPTQPPVRGRDDGFPGGLDGITFPKWRNETIKAYGNAIVPQVAFQIFKAINEYESKQFL